jgi:hypothetical protein
MSNVISPNTAAKIGDVDTVRRWAAQTPAKLPNESAILEATVMGHLNIVKWSEQTSRHFDGTAMIRLAAKGPSSVDQAVESEAGRIRVLEWLHNHEQRFFLDPFSLAEGIEKIAVGKPSDIDSCALRRWAWENSLCVAVPTFGYE